jgi:hypothetical protein
MPDCRCCIVVTPAKPIDPSYNDLIAGPDLVEQPATAGPICHFRGDSGQPIVRDDLVDLEASGFSVRPLVVDGLTNIRYTSV